MAKFPWQEDDPDLQGSINLSDTVAFLLARSIETSAELRVLRSHLIESGIQIEADDYNKAIDAEILKELKVVEDGPSDMARLGRIVRRLLSQIHDEL